jgi:hypothetical protein
MPLVSVLNFRGRSDCLSVPWLVSSSLQGYITTAVDFLSPPWSSFALAAARKKLKQVARILGRTDSEGGYSPEVYSSILLRWLLLCFWFASFV